MSGFITRLFKLERDLSQKDYFNKVGEHNLTTSIQTENGTLAMFATHLPEDESVCYVFEVYRDEAAYQVHASSPQFQAYVEMAGKTLVGRQVFPLRPELLLEKAAPLRVTGENKMAPRVAFVTVPPQHDEAFRAAVFENMRTSVAEENGVLALYAATLADDPTQWVFWELYADETAYAFHRETAHFQTYIARTAHCVAEKRLLALKADTMVSKGELSRTE